MITLILLCLIFIIIVSWVVYTSEATIISKLLTLPTLLIVIVSAVIHYNNQLGRPVFKRPTGTWSYVMHEQVGNYVYLVASDNKSPRLHIFRPTEDTEEKLGDIKSRSDNGIPVKGNFGQNSKGVLEHWDAEQPSK